MSAFTTWPVLGDDYSVHCSQLDFPTVWPQRLPLDLRLMIAVADTIAGGLPRTHETHTRLDEKDYLLKSIGGLILGFMIGFACYRLSITVPAPPALL